MKRKTVRFFLSQYVRLALIGGVFFAGCATSSPPPTRYPFSAKDWNGIDSVEFLEELRLENYARLVVEPVDTAATVLPPKDDNTYEPTVAVLQLTEGILLAELVLKLRGKLEVARPAAGTAAPDKTLLLRGKVADIHPGSRAARYWGGFGAGSAWVRINGQILDAKTGRVLLRFEQQRVASMGMFGGAYQPMLTDCVVEIGRDIGHLLSSTQTAKSR